MSLKLKLHFAEQDAADLPERDWESLTVCRLMILAYGEGPVLSFKVGLAEAKLENATDWPQKWFTQREEKLKLKNAQAKELCCAEQNPSCKGKLY